MNRTFVVLGLALALLVGAAGLSGAAPKKKKGKKGKPVWPLPNPSFKNKAFVPSSANRQISGVFGPRLKWGGARYDHHEGFDFFAQYDPSTYPRGYHPVLSVLPGVVSEVISPANPERTETGRKVVITHPFPWTAFGGSKEWGPVRTAYLHLSSIAVKKGDRVKAGQEVGRAGQSGYTSTTHLHLNAYRNGGRDVNVNPARLFNPKLFPGVSLPIHKSTVEVVWLERDKAAGTALVRVYLARNVYVLDGFVFAVDKDKRRSVSFEHVSATQRAKRDTGDEDLVPGLRIYPLRYNGGGAIERVNSSNVPRGWPMARYPVPGGKGVRLGFDLLATDVPPSAKKFKLTVFGVLGKKITATGKRFKAEK
ncbi:MAG: M23 family metallopeptidase [Planctomycetes bacterium]|nr:M23 family metallopeptidase [Planctomycetota bacterium]